LGKPEFPNLESGILPPTQVKIVIRFMRNTFRAVLSILLSALLAGCSTLSLDAVQRYVNVNTLVRAVATPDPQTIELTPTPVPPDYSTAALVKLRSMLRVGIRFDAPPLARVNDQGQLEGFDVELAREFARRWLGSEKNIEFVQVTSNSALDKVAAREVDLALGGLTISRASELRVDFSMPYAQDGEALLVRGGIYSDFASLAGTAVTYVDDNATFALRDAQNAYGVTITTKASTSYADAYNALIQRDVAGFAGRWRRLRTRAAQDPALQLLTVFKRESVAIMLPSNDSDWSDLVNITLSKIIADGTYERLYLQAFGAPPDFSAVHALSGTSDLQLAQLPDFLQSVDRLKTVRDARKLRVGYRTNQPFAFLEENSAPGGFEVELATAIGQRLIGAPDAVEFVPLAGDPAAALQNVDMLIGGLARTQEAERQLDFATPTYGTPTGTIAIGLPARQSALRDAVNLAIQQMRADGTYADIYGRYFPDSAPFALEIWR
jgi:aspartate/glutamate/glutamine transport system substrate-binding protein